ncbi:hypothetical protein PV797_19295 [Clostridiaceae bacterium M8S5]|nr:hypothetical protein PV797_19295 [Clostridiaceae bacterium M8S5]
MRKSAIVLSVAFILILVFATIYSINYKKNQLPTVNIDIPYSGLLKSKHYDCILPVGALYTDDDNRNYILLVIEKNGAWGKEYVCELKYISVIENSGTHVALKVNKMIENPVVVSSDQPIFNGSEVKIKKERLNEK